MDRYLSVNLARSSVLSVAALLEHHRNMRPLSGAWPSGRTATAWPNDFLRDTGLNGHKRGSSCRSYTHSLGVVTPNVIIIYRRYGIGAPIGPGAQAHTFRRYVGYVGFECFLPQAPPSHVVRPGLGFGDPHTTRYLLRSTTAVTFVLAFSKLETQCTIKWQRPL